MQFIGTHNGSHHADDAVGVAILLQLWPTAKVFRTRDPDVLAVCDAIVDVGGEHNEVINRFDHHQKGFSKRRENGIPYAGAGLVWLSWGAYYVQDICPWLGRAEALAIANDVDARLIQHVDAVDSGVSVPGPQDYGLSGIISTLNATWQDEASPEQDAQRFAEATSLAGIVLKNLVRTVAAEHRAVTKVMTGQPLAAGRILVLDAARLPYDAIVCEKMRHVLFVVYPESAGKQYQVRVVPKVLGEFAARADLPEAWAGLRGADLAEVTGVPDAVFCHNGRFICGAGSRAGAIRLAELAVAALN